MHHRPCGILIVLASLLAQAATGETVASVTPAVPSPRERVEILYDAYDVPHVYAKSIEDAYHTIGYVHAGERLWQMELLRRRASGTLADLLGADALASDELVRKLGIRRTAEESLRSGLEGADVPRWLAAYAGGVNAKLAELGSDGLPGEFRALGVVPAPWTPGDSAAFSKYMGWDQSGTDSDLWLGAMVEALGADAVAELWPLDRPYELTTIPAEDAVDRAAPTPTARNAISADIAALASRTVPRLMPAQSRVLIDRLAAAGPQSSRGAFGSNNWVVSGTKTATGKPLLANDPHLGFTIPSLWFAAHLVAPGLDVTGVMFPGQPFVTLGKNDRIAWGFTNMQSDAVDYFVETVNPENASEYRHRGEWKRFEERVETIAVRGAEPVKLTIRSTVHGPVLEVGDRLVALAWTGLRPTHEVLSIARLNHARGLDDFLDAMRVVDTPPMNVVYADVAGNIAMACWGDLPIRARGLGRVPVDGASGEFDWTGLIPRKQLPLSINPKRGWLASANGRPAPAGYPHHLGWMWDPGYRTRRIHALLAGAKRVSLSDMQRFQLDAHDVAAEAFTPVMIAAMKGTEGKLTSLERKALNALMAWEFSFPVDSTAGTIWNRWFARYRDAVWDDEWTSRGIVQPAGSWGYTGDNEREPALEVLEYLTRENPDSIWFDDRNTPQRETRDDILRASFHAAVADLAEQVGPDPARWTWGTVNRLAFEPLSPDPRSARGGESLRGGPFTLNPGGKGGPVSSGASWRQVVDFARLDESVSVYPGGQSGDPASPHYDDQLALWAKGEYARSGFADSPERVPEAQVTRRVTLVPREER